jgi:hypothetical protein
MSDLELPFRHPASCVRLAGARTFAHDAVLGRDHASAEATVTLDVVAERAPSTLRLAEGLLADTSVAFEWTDDGRLVTSSVESVGRAGAVATGLLTAGASLGGVLLAGPAMALSCAGASTATAHRMTARIAATAEAADGVVAQGGGAVASGASGVTDPAAAVDAAAVAGAYRAAHPDEAAALDDCATLVPDLAHSLAAAWRRVAAADDGKERGDAVAAARATETSLTAVRAQAAALDEHFRAWRAGTVTTRIEHHEFLLELDTLVAAQTLPELVDGKLVTTGAGDPANLAALAAVQEAFAALGVVVTVADQPGPCAGQAGSCHDHGGERVTPAENEVVVRLPRRVRLTCYELSSAGDLVPRSSTSALVMDERSPSTTVRLAKALFGKRAVRLGFSAGSALQSLRVAATSEVAGLAEAAAGLPNAAVLGFDRARRIAGRVTALRGAELDQRLSLLTRQLQLKRQEIAQAGLLATEGSYAELEALKREVALLEQRKALLALEADLGLPATTGDEVGGILNDTTGERTAP